jgi:hypothetical protein
LVCCECCMLSGRGLHDELVTSPEESCQLWCVIVRDVETSWMRRPWPVWTVVPNTNKPICLKKLMLQLIHTLASHMYTCTKASPWVTPDLV